MNKIEKLLQELCPEGVERVPFLDCATYTRGITYNKNQEALFNEPSSIKLFRANNITLGSNCLNFDEVKAVISQVKVKADQWLRKNDILICAGSGSKEHVGKVAYINEDMNYTFGGFMAVIRTKEVINSRFLFHLLIDNYFKDYLASALNSTTINNLNIQVMSGFEIPLPPLPIQQKIVSILDKFTATIDNIDKELELRKKQYEEYREKLLSSEEEECKISDFAYQPKERISADCLNENNYVSVENLLKDKEGKERASSVPKSGNWVKYAEGDILIGNIRPYLKKIWLADKDGGTNGDVVVVRPNNKLQLQPKFLFYIMGSDCFFDFYNSTAKGGKMPRGDKNRVLEFKVAVPSLECQQQIVSTLDKFEALISNLKQERELRQKQYEYYREQLLTFE